jgi:hypothetical protein
MTEQMPGGDLGADRDTNRLVRQARLGDSGPVTGAGIGGGALVGLESMISTVVPGW